MKIPGQVFVEGKCVSLGPEQLLQSGGEGVVFTAGGAAIKLYHQPSAWRTAKLRYLFAKGLPDRLPPHVLAPRRPVTDGAGNILGFQMALLPEGSQPFKQLSNPHYCSQMNVQTRQVAGLLCDAHRALQQIHEAGLVVGDLNDLNLHFMLVPAPPAVYWIDIDSYQWGSYPCPVATLPFLDPRLYDVGDFRVVPSFSALTDWYAFAVLLVKVLLRVHPYGGVHHKYHSLQARALEGVSILNPQVTYPLNARPLAALSDDLLHYVHLIFEKGKRSPIPLSLLQEYEQSLIRCQQCGLSYPASRPNCPACTQGNREVRPALRRQGVQIRRPFAIGGALLQVAVQPGGRIYAVVRRGKEYWLLRGSSKGVEDEIFLFSGEGGYRLACFSDTVVVNPYRSRQLLLLEVAGAEPRKIGVFDTASFGNNAVFAATPSHLYRIANGYILKGQLRHGRLLEEVVATAHRDQTFFEASPLSNRLAGYHRIFDHVRLFLLDQAGNYCELDLPGGTHCSGMRHLTACFGQHKVAYLWQTGPATPAGQAKDVQTHVAMVGVRGRLDYYMAHVSEKLPLDYLEGCVVQQDALLYATDQGVVRATPGQYTLLAGTAGAVASGDRLMLHPDGLLVQRPEELLLLSLS